MGDLQRREFQEALLDAGSFEDCPGSGGRRSSQRKGTGHTSGSSEARSRVVPRPAFERLESPQDLGELVLDRPLVLAPRAHEADANDPASVRGDFGIAIADGCDGGDCPPHAIPGAQILVSLERGEGGASSEHGDECQHSRIPHALGT